MLKVEFSPNLVNSRGVDYSLMPFIKEGIGSMPPGYELKTLLDFGPNYFGNKELPSSYVSNITYHGGLKLDKRYSEQILDLSVYEELVYVYENGMDELVKEIEKIREDEDSTKNSIEGIKKLLENGIWIKNPSLMINSTNMDSDVWKSTLISKLNEFIILWTKYLDEEMRNINPFNTDMRNRFSTIGSQILSLLSNYPQNVSNSDLDVLIDIGAKIFRLGRFHFFYDGNGDKEGFEKFGTEIVDLVDKIIIRL